MSEDWRDLGMPEDVRKLLDHLDLLAGEWRSVHNLLMEAAVKARRHESAYYDQTTLRYAKACEAVASTLANTRIAINRDSG